jgi:hypothetical protein
VNVNVDPTPGSLSTVMRPPCSSTIAREGEPESRAFHALRRRADLPEFLEHRLLILLRDADTRVAHGNRDHAVLRRDAHADASTVRREFEGIGKQVEQHLLDLALVGANGSDRRSGLRTRSGITGGMRRRGAGSVAERRVRGVPRSSN